MKAKQLKTVLLVISLFLFSLAVKASNKTDSLYTIAMKSSIQRMDTLNGFEDIQLCKMIFERIHQMYPNDWLSLYYVIYSDLKSFYHNPRHLNSRKLLEESGEKLKLLKKYKNGNMSEILTLEGYYYMALVMSDPSKYGPKYSKNVITAYEKAMELDKNNPRPICLLAFFEQKLPKMLQSKRNPKIQHDKAKELFVEEVKDSILPHWGEFYLKQIKFDD
jgi:tetratricopeptide (TPR) repeat protein